MKLVIYDDFIWALDSSWIVQYENAQNNRQKKTIDTNHWYKRNCNYLKLWQSHIQLTNKPCSPRLVIVQFCKTIDWLIDYNQMRIYVAYIYSYSIKFPGWYWIKISSPSPPPKKKSLFILVRNNRACIFLCVIIHHNNVVSSIYPNSLLMKLNMEQTVPLCMPTCSFFGMRHPK